MPETVDVDRLSEALDSATLPIAWMVRYAESQEGGARPGDGTAAAFRDPARCPVTLSDGGGFAAWATIVRGMTLPQPGTAAWPSFVAAWSFVDSCRARAPLSPVEAALGWTTLSRAFPAATDVTDGASASWSAPLFCMQFPTSGPYIAVIAERMIRLHEGSRDGGAAAASGRRDVLKILSGLFRRHLPQCPYSALYRTWVDFYASHTPTRALTTLAASQDAESSAQTTVERPSLDALPPCVAMCNFGAPEDPPREAFQAANEAHLRTELRRELLHHALSRVGHDEESAELWLELAAVTLLAAQLGGPSAPVSDEQLEAVRHVFHSALAMPLRRLGDVMRTYLEFEAAIAHRGENLRSSTVPPTNVVVPDAVYYRLEQSVHVVERSPQIVDPARCGDEWQTLSHWMSRVSHQWLMAPSAAVFGCPPDRGAAPEEASASSRIIDLTLAHMTGQGLSHFAPAHIARVLLTTTLLNDPARATTIAADAVAMLAMRPSVSELEATGRIVLAVLARLFTEGQNVSLEELKNVSGALESLCTSPRGLGSVRSVAALGRIALWKRHCASTLAGARLHGSSRRLARGSVSVIEGTGLRDTLVGDESKSAAQLAKQVLREAGKKAVATGDANADVQREWSLAEHAVLRDATILADIHRRTAEKAKARIAPPAWQAAANQNEGGALADDITEGNTEQRGTTALPPSMFFDDGVAEHLAVRQCLLSVLTAQQDAVARGDDAGVQAAAEKMAQVSDMAALGEAAAPMAVIEAWRLLAQRQASTLGSRAAAAAVARLHSFERASRAGGGGAAGQDHARGPASSTTVSIHAASAMLRLGDAGNLLSAVPPGEQLFLTIAGDTSRSAPPSSTNSDAAVSASRNGAARLEAMMRERASPLVQSIAGHSMTEEEALGHWTQRVEHGGQVDSDNLPGINQATLGRAGGWSILTECPRNGGCPHGVVGIPSTRSDADLDEPVCSRPLRGASHTATARLKIDAATRARLDRISRESARKLGVMGASSGDATTFGTRRLPRVLGNLVSQVQALSARIDDMRRSPPVPAVAAGGTAAAAGPEGTTMYRLAPVVTVLPFLQPLKALRTDWLVEVLMSTADVPLRASGL